MESLWSCFFESVIADAEHFVQYLSEVCNSALLYLEKTEIIDVDVTITVYQEHFKCTVSKKVNKSKTELILISLYKKPSTIVKSLDHGF